MFSYITAVHHNDPAGGNSGDNSPVVIKSQTWSAKKLVHRLSLGPGVC